jgi:hypothetical protein
MNEATTILSGGADVAVRSARRGRRRLWRHHLWLVPGLAIAIFANQLGTTNGIGILALIAFGIVPDVPRLFGSRGRPMHGLLHQPVAAVAVAGGVVAGVATGLVPIVALVAALVWLSHVVIGRAVGDVPRGRGA